MTRRIAQVGTVIAGTLNPADLIPAFARELQWLSATERSTEESNLLAEAGDVAPDSEEGQEVIFELMDMLDTYAPEGFHFGAHEGDGADFGFWPLELDTYR